MTNINNKDEIVISGVAGLFPHTRNLTEFKEFLLSNEYKVGKARWREGQLRVCDKVHNILDEDLFDPVFFGMHRQQAKVTSVLQKLVIERAFEAIFDAGVHPSEINGKKVGVFMACEINETSSILHEMGSGFTLTGQVGCLMANRISYFFNLKGPSYTCNASWNGGVQLLDLAVNAIRSGQCESAIIGGCNVAFNPAITFHYSTLGILSDNGVTKAFDANASGYGRAEAAVCLFIQKADIARRHYATVLHASVSYDGNRTGGLLDVDTKGIKDRILSSYQESGVDPLDVEYLESYGCGIKNIDEKELAAVEQVFCVNRKRPLDIGSVKTNIGHTECAADFLSICKVIVAMESGIIPATLHYETPNPNIPALTSGKLQVVTKNKPWNGGIAAINSFGYSSSYGHIILRSNPKKNIIPKIDLPVLTVFSARTESGVNKMAESIKADTDYEYIRLLHNVFSQDISRHLYRGYVVGGDEPKSETNVISGDKRPIWFVYSGMGSQWHTMGRDLMQIPIFAKSIEKCQAALADKNVDLKRILTADEPELFENILHSFVAIAAVQVALTDIVTAMGIVPNGIIGHSTGELGCAYADGCVTAEQTVLGAYYRGLASLEAELIVGKMAAVGLGYQKIKDMCPPDIFVACHNAADSCTLTGPAKSMEVFIEELTNKGIFARLVNVSNLAYHSKYIQPAAPYLLKYLQTVLKDPKPRTSKWISTSIPESNWNSELARTVSAEYMTNNLLSPVLFEEGSKHIPENAIAIELAPHGILQAILKRALKGVSNISLTKRNAPGIDYLFTALGNLYLEGANYNISALYPPMPFPVSRNTKNIADLVHWSHDEHWESQVIVYLSTAEKEFLITPNVDEYKYLADYQVDERNILPVTLFLDLVYNISSATKTVNYITFENVVFHDFVDISQTYSASIVVLVQEATGYFEITDKKNVLVSGYMKTEVPEKQLPNALSDSSTVIQNEIQSADFYKELEDRGYKYPKDFKLIKSVSITDDGIIGLVRWEKDWKKFVEVMIQLQLLHAAESKQNIVIPRFIQEMQVALSDLPSEFMDIDVNYNSRIGCISTSKISITGIEFREFLPVPKEICLDILDPLPITNGSQPEQNLSPYEIVHIDQNELSLNDLTIKSKPWTAKLLGLIKKNDQTRIFIVAKVEPTEGIVKFTNKIQELAPQRSMRFVFILDKNAPEFSKTDNYQDIFKNDFKLSILRNDKWNTFNSISTSTIDGDIENKINNSITMSTLSNEFSKTCKVKYVGLHPTENFKKAEIRQYQMENIDYAGISENNKKIMGVATTDVDSCQATPDQVLIWSVPDSWTLSEAATVPYAYTVAYYAFFELVDLQKGESVLIHAASTAFSQAAINIALANDCTVYTTVANDDQRAMLLKRFPQLDDTKIYNSENTCFEQYIAYATDGKGVQVVINCFSGDRFEASKRSLGLFGRFVQICSEEETDRTGMSVFLMNTVMVGISPKTIMSMDPEVKLKIKNLITDGIKNKVVKPLSKIPYNRDQVNDLFKYMKSPNVTESTVLNMTGDYNMPNNTIYKCTEKGTYIIYGGASESWIHLVEWLTKRSAKHIVIIISSQKYPNYINRRLTLMSKYYNTKITVKMQNGQTLNEIVDTTNESLPIKDIFIFGSNYETVSKHMSNINGFNRAKIIIFMDSSTEVFNGINNAITITWESNRKFEDVITVLDEILHKNGKYYILKNNHLFLEEQEQSDIFKFYPKRVPEIEELGKRHTNTSQIVPQTSKYPRNMSNFPPLFIVSGLYDFNAKHIQKFMQNLLAPVYRIDVNTSELKNNKFASVIAKELLEKHESKIYNIVGISFGGILAIEIAKCLEKLSSAKVQLSLIDTAPKTIQNCSKYFANCGDFQKSFVTKSNLTEYKYPTYFKQGLDILESYTNYANTYTSNENHVSGLTYLIRPGNAGKFDYCDLNQHCQNIRLENLEGDHGTMLESKELIKFLNENIHI